METAHREHTAARDAGDTLTALSHAATTQSVHNHETNPLRAERQLYSPISAPRLLSTVITRCSHHAHTPTRTIYYISYTRHRLSPDLSATINMSSLSLLSLLCFLLLSLLPLLSAQYSSSSGGAVYNGYSLSSSGDPASTTYQTDDTPAAVPNQRTQPDVHLNATVHVSEIDLTVSNITAKINLDAQVLNLLQFNAGVSASIDRVRLVIQEVDAEVLLEARLENLVLMISDVLDSIDLNPVIATLAGEVGNAVTNLADGLTSSTGSATPALQATPLTPMATIQPITNSINLVNNVLYSINDYSGQTHTNRVLLTNGSIADERLDGNGRILYTTLVGYYKTDMTYNGQTTAATVNGMSVEQQEWVYTPMVGLSVVCLIDVNATTGSVVSAQVMSESFGGGDSTVATP